MVCGLKSAGPSMGGLWAVWVDCCGYPVSTSAGIFFEIFPFLLFTWRLSEFSLFCTNFLIFILTIIVIFCNIILHLS